MMNDRMQLTLPEIIARLIGSKQEGEFWDFKKQWYAKNSKADMLHDILCFANNMCNRDSYIIIGVDEEQDYAVVGVDTDENRKNTADIVNFLRSRKFAGEMRPLVTVDNIPLNDGMVDVIVIHNSNNTPFYLIEPYKDEHNKTVRAYYIYTRIMDTNTPIDKSADLPQLEALWRKRFRINEPIIQKMAYFLQSPENWISSPIEYEERMYYRFFPEFQIAIQHSPERTAREFYMEDSLFLNPSWYMATLYYHQTALDQFLCIYLVESDCFLLAPSIEIFRVSDDFSVWYAYYESDTLKYTLYQFFQAVADHDVRYTIGTQAYLEGILVFEQNGERAQFHDFVRKNVELLSEEIRKVEAEKNGWYEKQTPEDRGKHIQTITLNRILKVFRTNNHSLTQQK